MNEELEKLMTPELLSDVLDFNEYKKTNFKSFEFSDRSHTTAGEYEMCIYIFKESKKKDGTGCHSWDWINLDTLQRKMKEWLNKKGYSVRVLSTIEFSKVSIYDGVWLENPMHEELGAIDIEAVVKATLWAREQL